MKSIPESINSLLCPGYRTRKKNRSTTLPGARSSWSVLLTYINSIGVGAPTLRKHVNISFGDSGLRYIKFLPMPRFLDVETRRRDLCGYQTCSISRLD